MKFEQQEQWRLYKQVEACLEREFGDVAEASDTDPAFMLHLGAVLLMVTVDPVGPDHASVLMYARPGEHVDVTPEIAHFLLRTSHDLAFGKLGLKPEDDAITFTHMVMGEGLLDDSLTLLLHLLSESAEEIDNELRQRYG